MPILIDTDQENFASTFHNNMVELCELRYSFMETLTDKRPSPDDTIWRTLCNEAAAGIAGEKA